MGKGRVCLRSVVGKRQYGGRTFGVLVREIGERTFVGLIIMLLWTSEMGKSYSFWKDKWFPRGALKSRFRRLFDLAVDKDISIAEINRLVWMSGVGGGRLEMAYEVVCLGGGGVGGVLWAFG
ncbi:hypothetical protein L195_g012399 [Trifolium pratense]|uniref:Cysteine-rich receptor-like protein kinase n=1 Tax=Trifolium pratense TaxID=57577 RepID=A0A2K3PK78_TRIPR|nr:hypothetical protein L195_g012399 [Trifolium pratense]